MITEEMVERRVQELFADHTDTWEGFDDHLKNVHRAAAHRLLRRELAQRDDSEGGGSHV